LQFGSSASVTSRVASLLGWVVLACVPILGWYAAIFWGWVSWPRASEPLPLVLGVLAAGIIGFEMALAIRKRARGKKNRITGKHLKATKWWTRWHVYLGILALPLGVLHSAFHFGGPLTTVLLLLFVVVILSGVWGLIVQQWLPSKLLNDFPNETIISEVPGVMKSYEPEIEGLIRITADGSSELKSILETQLKPYLMEGKKHAIFSDPEACRKGFSQWRERYPSSNPAVLPALARLETMCQWRREWRRQGRVYFWLHSWLLIHLPLSLALSVLLILHVFVALKIW